MVCQNQAITRLVSRRSVCQDRERQPMVDTQLKQAIWDQHNIQWLSHRTGTGWKFKYQCPETEKVCSSRTVLVLGKTRGGQLDELFEKW